MGKKSNAGDFAAFLKRKDINISAKVYFVDAMGAMALGLFATLLIGTIFSTIGKNLGVEFCNEISTYAQAATGMALGVAIAHKLKAPPLVIFSCAVVGHIANSLPFEYMGNKLTAGPAGAFFVVIVACELGKVVSKETKVDILVTPVVTILAGYGLSLLICPALSFLIYYISVFIGVAMTWAPLLMGIVVAVVVGMILTLPISSAAICAMLFSATIIETSQNAEALKLAAGAAAVGCCAQMVGFAVSSFRENKWGGLVAQGLGTSMLQMGNIVKKPVIWLPPTLAGAVCGALSAAVFKLQCAGVAAGMGTCGLVGPIGVVSTMTENSGNNAMMMWTGIAALCFVLPAVLSLAFSELFRKIGWIKENDMKLPM